MNTFAVNIPNEAITEKVLWFLNHLKDEGVVVKNISDISNLNDDVKSRIEDIENGKNIENFSLDEIVKAS